MSCSGHGEIGPTNIGRLIIPRARLFCESIHNPIRVLLVDGVADGAQVTDGSHDLHFHPGRAWGLRGLIQELAEQGTKRQ